MFDSIMRSIPHDANRNLFYASTVHHFGINGLWFLNNNHFDDESNRCFNQFYAKYLRIEPRSIAAEVVVRRGDVVKIKSLKPQNNSDLQFIAWYLDGSFGKISTFLPGDLTRKNSRNQTEIAIQSLFDSDMKLALRPKYLCRITKLHFHRIWDDVGADCKSFWEIERNELLYIPYFHKDEKLHVIVANRFCKQQGLMFAMHNQGKANIIIDPAISACTILMDVQQSRDSVNIRNVFCSLPFCMDRVTGKRIMRNIVKMRKSSRAKERIFIEAIEKLFDAHYAKMKGEKTKLFNNSGTFGQRYSSTCEFHLELKQKIERDLKKAHGKKILALYSKLLDEIVKETKIWVAGLHQDYWREFDEFFGSFDRLFRVCVIQNYLKANAKGHDLHVIYYGDEDEELLNNLSAAFSEKINVEWNINDLMVAQMLTSRIII